MYDIDMAKTVNRLTSRSVSTFVKPGYHCDGRGLYLRVSKQGTKSWVYRFCFGGRTRDAGLGSYPEVGLSEARKRAETYRRQVREGIDPIEVRQQARAEAARQAASQVTFKNCAKEYISAHEASWRNAKHRQQWRSTLKTYAFPIIGSCPVADVETRLVMKILQPIWLEKPETASRLRGRIERVLSWAKVHGFRDGDDLPPSTGPV